MGGGWGCGECIYVSDKLTPQAQDQKVLTDFFNQLLAKRPTGSKGSSLVSSKSPSTKNVNKDNI